MYQVLAIIKNIHDENNSSLENDTSRFSSVNSIVPNNDMSIFIGQIVIVVYPVTVSNYIDVSRNATSCSVENCYSYRVASYENVACSLSDT